jgi:cell division control protein 24
VLHKANDAVNRDLLDESLDELIVRVDDWKGHRVDQFGKLLLHGVYGVVTGKSDAEKDVSQPFSMPVISPSKFQHADSRAQYEIYLFECILLCCKEVNASKSKDKKDKTRSQGPKIKNKNAKLQLKGRIFMTNVTDIVSMSKPGTSIPPFLVGQKPRLELISVRRFTQRANMLERRPGRGELYNQVHQRGDDAQMGHRTGDPT